MFHNFKALLKVKIFEFAGELATHMGNKMADAFENRGQQIMLFEMEQNDLAEQEELGLPDITNSADAGKKAN